MSRPAVESTLSKLTKRQRLFVRQQLDLGRTVYEIALVMLISEASGASRTYEVTAEALDELRAEIELFRKEHE